MSDSAQPSSNGPWTSEYTSYATSQGLSPAECMERDERKYVGGSMTGFIRWVDAALRQMRTEQPDKFLHGRLCDQKAKLSFLQDFARRPTVEPLVSDSDPRLTELRLISASMALADFRARDGKCEECMDTGRLHHCSPGGTAISFPCACVQQQ